MIAATTHNANPRVTSIDALRGLVMFAMICVNELSGVSHAIVPDWMRHYHGKSGMTFVDVVFPAFLFIAGMSIPFALGSRLEKGEPPWKIMLHILTRAASLILLGVLMVNDAPDSARLGWPAKLWLTLMYLSAIFAFCSFRPPTKPGAPPAGGRIGAMISPALRVAGFAGLSYLAFVFVGKDDHRIIQLSPFSISTKWYGILGEIGWSYLITALIFLGFRCRRTALLGCLALLYCLYPARKLGAFGSFWLARHLNLGETGTQAGIMLAGTLLATTLLTADTSTHKARARFTLWLIAGCAAGAWLLNGLYGINKGSATPSYALWTTAIAAALWLGFYCLADVRHGSRMLKMVKPLTIAGGNVLLAYLLSEMLHPFLDVMGLRDYYSGFLNLNLICALVGTSACSVGILALAVLLNRLGFRLKL